MNGLVRVRDIKLDSAPGTELLRALRLEAGVEDIETTTATTLRIRYRLPETTLNALVHWLGTRGAPLGGSVINRIWIFVCGHMDAVQCETARNESSWDVDLRRLYISRELKRQHGRRDERARHWRRYLARDEGMQ